nr:hypothetical protein [Tanacetum cinerariifolium]
MGDVRALGAGRRDGVRAAHILHQVAVEGDVAAQTQVKISCLNGLAIKLKLQALVANARVAQVGEDARGARNSRNWLVEQQVVRVAEVDVGNQQQAVIKQAHVEPYVELRACRQRREAAVAVLGPKARRAIGAERGGQEVALVVAVLHPRQVREQGFSLLAGARKAHAAGSRALVEVGGVGAFGRDFLHRIVLKTLGRHADLVEGRALGGVARQGVQVVLAELLGVGR